MGVITIKIKDHIEKILREEALRRYGGKRGSLSSIIEEALLAWLKAASKKGVKTYQVVRDNKVLFESNDLDEVARFLNENNIRVSDVIIKIAPSKKEYRIGPRLQR